MRMATSRCPTWEAAALARFRGGGNDRWNHRVFLENVENVLEMVGEERKYC